MPNTRSSKKRMRQSLTRYATNRRQRSALRTAIKRVTVAASPEDAQTAYRVAERLLDRAAKKRLIHPNVAARTKSRLLRKIAG